MASTCRIGVDENGLGARLGPLVVTAVLARVNEAGVELLEGGLPAEIGRDLNDSKRLVSHANVDRGEAWARVVVDESVRSPGALLTRLSLEGIPRLQEPCPGHVRPQCWGEAREAFCAPPLLLQRIRAHHQQLRARGVELIGARSSVVCTQRLNLARAHGKSRFTMDLHAMEALVLALRELAGTEVLAVCGKVGGIGNYRKFFGPLAGRLHTVLEEGPARSTYRMPGIGTLSFVRDVDAVDPLVMLASLVGKYLRELLMGRIADRYAADAGDEPPPSGYHDPRTARFVERTAAARRRLRVPNTCFERTTGTTRRQR